MFKLLLENEYHKEMQLAAKNNILKERLKYKDIIYYILGFSKTNNLLVSNIDILLDKVDYWENVHLFSVNADETAKVLVSLLCKTFDKLFVLKIFELNKEYYIEYDLRRICIINTIKPYKNITVYDFIAPIKYVVNNKLNISLMPYFIEVIELYKRLYDPLEAGEWTNILENINMIEKCVDKEIITYKISTKDTLSVLLSSSVVDGGSADVCKPNRKKNIENIKNLLLDLMEDSHFVLCHDDTNIHDVIEVISKDITKDYQIIVNYLSKFFMYPITYKKKSLYLPKEDYLEKYHFYIEIPCGINVTKKHFLTIYTNMSYELIHYYIDNKLKYADPIIQIRFKYIGIWSAIIKQRIHGIKYNDFINYLNKMHTGISRLRGKINIYEHKKNFVGEYIPANTIKKILTTKSNTKATYYCYEV